MATKTPAELDDLMRQWTQDPCWELAGTEGFEEHADELRAFQTLCEANWESAADRHLRRKADELGIPGNIQLAHYIDMLEYRLKDIDMRHEQLAEIVYRLEGK